MAKRSGRIQEGPEATAYGHPSASRANNPAAETAEFMSDEFMDGIDTESELPEFTGMPKLKWIRMPERELKAYPLWKQQKVSAEAIVQQLMKVDRNPTLEDLFTHRFNGLPLDAGWKPYEYLENWSNRLVKADGAKAMNSFIHHDGLEGKVQLVYMDPPYNISFRSNFMTDTDDLEVDETLDSVPDDLGQIKAFRDTYKNGIHSYLDQLHEQLVLARRLLSDEGSFIMQIGPDNLHQVAMLMGEVFDPNNHVATIPYVTRTNSSTNMIPEIGNWLIWFAKDKNRAKYRQLYKRIESTEELVALLHWDAMVQLPDGKLRNLSPAEKSNPSTIDSDGILLMRMPSESSKKSLTGRSDNFYWHKDGKRCPGPRWDIPDSEFHEGHNCDPVKCDGVAPDDWDTHQCTAECHGKRQRQCPRGRKCGPKCKANAYPCPTDKQWSVSLSGLQTIADSGRLYATSNQRITWLRKAEDLAGPMTNAMWETIGAAQDKQYVVETPPKVLDRCILMTTDPGDLVLDLTCGSGAMPVRCEEWGRRWIATDVSTVSIHIAQTRLVTTTYTHHVLRDSKEGHKADHERRMALLPPNDPLRQLPFKYNRNYGHDPAKGFVNERQARVSAKTLAYGPDLSENSKDIIVHPDRTMIDNKKVRVASNFTVESGTFRAITPGEETTPEREAANQDSVARIISSLLKSGIRAGAKQAYEVHSIIPAAELQQATHVAEIFPAEGGEKIEAAVYIGREDETIAYARVNRVAREAHGKYSHVLIAGYAKEGDALQERSQHPAAKVLYAEASADIQLSGLKDGAGDNAFNLISEPDIRVKKLPDGKYQLEAKGINAYDTGDGTVNTTSSRKPRAMMVDTQYDEMSFKARMMHILPGRRNSRTLRNFEKAFGNRMDPEKFKQFKTLKTMPFEWPTDGSRVAVRVVDQTGVEHMAVLDTPEN